MFKENRGTSTSISTLYRFDTVFCADSVEWCPNEPHTNYLVCGNYHLQEEQPSERSKQQKRIGKIHLFSTNPESGLKLHQTLNTAGVLDQKWCHNTIDGYSLLGVANAEKRLEIYKLENDIVELTLITAVKISSECEEVLALSLDWSTGKYSSNKPSIVVSDSKGNIHVFKYSNGNIDKIHEWLAHNYETWISAFDYWNPSVIFTGADDCRLLKFDTRAGTEPISICKYHEAGVTALHSNSDLEYILPSGSYDGKIALWDHRKMKTPVNSLEMPECVWRLKWDPHKHRYLLAACMRGGFHIVSVTDPSVSSEIVASYFEHTDLSYGSDWSYMNEKEVAKYSKESTRIFASCSFYDHKLCVSAVHL